MDWSRRETLLGLGAALATGCAGRREPRRVLTCDDAGLSRAECRELSQRLVEPAEPFSDHPLALDALIAEHTRRYPRMEPADAYKLCHHRFMGPGHLVSQGDALAWLQREAAELAPLPEGAPEVEAEVLSQPKGLFRVRLRPWIAHGRDLESLTSAFAETAARWTPRPGALRGALVRVGQLLGSPEVPLGCDQVAWEAFVIPLAEQGLPAVHHSEVYRASYAPAYRVVLVELIGGGG